jgi:GNAT superfamily N-acetyltransferase
MSGFYGPGEDVRMAGYGFPRLASLADVASLRAARVASLAAPPELFVELRVRRSAVHAIERDGLVGYLTTLDGTLTELFLVPEHRTHADAVLAQAAGSLALERAWATTFDPVALAACTSASRSYEVLGLCFRALTVAVLPTPDPLPTERLATPADVDRVLEASHADVFDDAAEVALWVGSGWVTLFELPDGLAGFGLCTPVGPPTTACDVGVRVCPAHQRRGLGSWIVQRMADRARSRGLVPTAGCAVGNTRSRRTLERAGFVADHRLLQFEL